MTRQIRRWALPTLALLVLALTLVACGRVAPSFQPGNIAVTSTPAGATIYLDGVDQELVTPATLTDLEPANYLISVELEGYLAAPDVQTAIVTPLETTELQDFTLSQTSLVVTSTPSGASIFINGEDQEQTTPATIVGVPAGNVDVSLQLDGYLVTPAVFSATVVEGEANEVPADTFVLRARHTVLCEGFSNVSCQGCPEMAHNMDDLMHRSGNGLDRALYIKYSMNWPLSTDPNYTYNSDENDARMNYYLNYLLQGIPVLTMEGVKITGTSANSTPTADETEVYLHTNQVVDPGFLIDVTADFTAPNVPASITLTALEDVSLADKTLFVALVQTLVEFEEPPGSEGETEFHYVFRDRADSVGPLIDLTSGQTQTINTTLLRADWDLDTLLVIAFVQDDSDKSILQAGSTAATLSAPAHHFINPDQPDRIITAGGE